VFCLSNRVISVETILHLCVWSSFWNIQKHCKNQKLDKMGASLISIWFWMCLLTLFSLRQSLKHTIFFTYYFPISLKRFLFCFHIPSKNHISFTYLISFSISCFPPFQISFVLSICSRFVSVSLQCHRMWSVVSLLLRSGIPGYTEKKVQYAHVLFRNVHRYS
jgi:hypothetical protein